MSSTHSFVFSSWIHLYQALRAKAEATRGIVTVAHAAAPGAMFPHTSAKDAFAISVLFDGAVAAHLPETTVELWNQEADLVDREVESCGGPYVGNRSFWQMLAAVALELDRAGAPLPESTQIDDAMKQLATSAPPANPALRNATVNGSGLMTQFTAPTWRSMALRQLELFFRLRGDEIVVGSSQPMRVPATRNGDVLALVDYWTDQLARVGEHATQTHNRLVFSSWREVMGQVERFAKRFPPHEPYPCNPEFWQALILVAIESDACNAPASPWVFQLVAAGTAPRNATAVATDTGVTLEFPAAPTWDDAARMQRDAFAQLRGEDVVTGRLITRVPRTTVADVRQLAAYWQRTLSKVVMGRTGDITQSLDDTHWADISSVHVMERWRAAVADVDHVPLTVAPDTVYARNVDFWEALMTFAIQVAVTDEAPTRWQLATKATAKAVHELPTTLKNAASGAASAVLGMAGDVVAAVLKKPLLYAGVGLSGLALILLLRPGASQAASATSASRS